jgi:hypothetical protein
MFQANCKNAYFSGCVCGLVPFHLQKGRPNPNTPRDFQCLSPQINKTTKECRLRLLLEHVKQEPGNAQPSWPVTSWVVPLQQRQSSSTNVASPKKSVARLRYSVLIEANWYTICIGKVHGTQQIGSKRASRTVAFEPVAPSWSLLWKLPLQIALQLSLSCAISSVAP